MPVKVSIRKTRRLRQYLTRNYKLPEPPDPQPSTVDQLVMTVLWVDSPPAKVRQAYAKLGEHFVDWNEMRVSMTSEIGGVLEACGLPATRAAALKRVLSRAIEDLYGFDFDALGKRPRQDLKAWFTSIEGVPHPVMAAILYHVYHFDRVLVDSELARVVQRLGLVSETTPEPDIEVGLAKVIPARDAHFVYSALRQHALTVCTKKDFDCRACPLRKTCPTGKQRIAELEAAAREARKKARAEAKRKREAARRRKAARKRKAAEKRKAEPKRKPARKRTTPARKRARKKK